MFETVYYSRPNGDNLFKYLADNLKGCELDGYTRMAAFNQDGEFKGCAALKYTEKYCSIDIFAPNAKFTRHALKSFFDVIFGLVPLCLCVIRNKNAQSLYFVTRLGFKAVKITAKETLFSLTKNDFERAICTTK